MGHKAAMKAKHETALALLTAPLAVFLFWVFVTFLFSL